ncbi:MULTISPECIES: ATP-binding protein [Nitrosospira]|nr:MULTISPECIES: ATP-binding protein [Nitrosospira]
MANCKAVFFSYASEDHVVEPKDKAVEPLVKELIDCLETESFDFNPRFKNKLRDTTNDTITKLYDEIKECDLVIHLVGSHPGDTANGEAIREFYEILRMKNEEFLSENKKGKKIKPYFESLETELTYAQWEAYLAIHLGKAMLVYSPLSGSDNRLASQQKHLKALKEGRSHLQEHATASRILLAIQNHFKTKLPPLPKSLDFEEYLAEKRKHFTGRQWMFEEIDEWLETPEASKAFLITGDPGIGKSAIVAQLINNDVSNQIIAHHCCQAGLELTLESWRFVQSIAAMIASRLKEYKNQLNDWILIEDKCQKDPSIAFEHGVLTVLNKLPPPKSGVCYILIDALDEALTLQSDGKTIVSLLADTLKHFPKWLRIVATTRRVDAVLNRIKNHIELRASDEKNIDDLKSYINYRLTKNDNHQQELEKVASEFSMTIGDFREKIIRTLIKCGSGNFLYASTALNEIGASPSSCNQQTFSLRRINEWPEGLHGIYEEFFQRHFGEKDKYSELRPILEMICSAREPLEESVLRTAAPDLNDYNFQDRLRALKQFLSMYENPIRYAPYHKSLTDWLMDDNTRRTSNFWIQSEEGDRKLADFCFDESKEFFHKTKEFINTVAPSNEYWVRHGGFHLLKIWDYLYKNKKNLSSAYASKKYEYINQSVNILEWVSSFPETRNIVASTLPLLIPVLKKTERDLDPFYGETANTALRVLEEMDEQKLFNLVKDTVATDITESVIRWIGKTQIMGWQNLIPQMLELNEYVIRYSAGCGQAERYYRLLKENQAGCAAIEIDYLLDVFDVDQQEMGSYAVGEIAKKESKTGKIQSQVERWLKKVSDTDIYFCQSVLGDVLLNLALQSKHGHAKSIIAKLDQSDLISAFWDPIWMYTRLDVIAALALLKEQGQQLNRDTTSFQVEVEREVSAIRARQERIAKFENEAGEKWKILTRIPYKTEFSDEDIDVIHSWLTRKGAEYRHRVNMAVELLKLIFTHPLWQVCEKGAAIFPLLGSESDWRDTCFDILDQLMESLDSSENDSGIANWRIILGTSEACYLIRHLDLCDYKGKGILRMEHCWNEYYDHPNCHVRALIAEGLFGIVGEMESDLSGYDTGYVSYLKNHTQKIECWLLDDEIWVLEHAYQAFRNIVKMQKNNDEGEVLQFWIKERLKHVEENPDCLLARVSKQMGKSWTELERSDFLRQIQVIQRSQLLQQRVNH